MNWYYAEAGTPAGPFSEDQMAGMVQSGQVTPETPVWRTGTAEWILAAEAFGSRSSPPPISTIRSVPTRPVVGPLPVRTTANHDTENAATAPDRGFDLYETAGPSLKKVVANGLVVVMGGVAVALSFFAVQPTQAANMADMLSGSSMYAAAQSLLAGDGDLAESGGLSADASPPARGSDVSTWIAWAIAQDERDCEAMTTPENAGEMECAGSGPSWETVESYLNQHAQEICSPTKDGGAASLIVTTEYTSFYSLAYTHRYSGAVKFARPFTPGQGLIYCYVGSAQGQGSIYSEPGSYGVNPSHHVYR